MSDDAITPRRFSDAEGLDDWRALAHGASAHFRTGDFAAGVRLVGRIAELAEAADHHPDVDLRYAGVTVRLVSHDVGDLSERDVRLARDISAAARDLGVPADPGAVQDVQLTLDALVSSQVLPFWQAVLGYRAVGEDDLADPHGRWPSIRFQRMDTPRPQRNRIHLDVWVPDDQAQARVETALAAGGRLVTEEHAPAWWTLADAEGNEVDIATWRSRD